MIPADVTACKGAEDKCNKNICGNSVNKDFATCVSYTKSISDLAKCNTNPGDCTYKICQSTAGIDTQFCKASYCTKHPSATQCLIPADVTACKGAEDKCNKDICGNSANKVFPKCEAFNCNANVADCTYAICQSPSGKDT